jgi:hypothetical protein
MIPRNKRSSGFFVIIYFSENPFNETLSWQHLMLKTSKKYDLLLKHFKKFSSRDNLYLFNILCMYFMCKDNLVR